MVEGGSGVQDVGGVGRHDGGREGGGVVREEVPVSVRHTAPTRESQRVMCVRAVNVECAAANDRKMKLDESSGDWLDILPKHFQRSPPGPPLPPTPGSYDQPIMLIGIVSALQLRRDLLRCTWLRELSSIGGTRTLFVVGANAGDSGSADVLPTHIEEQQLMRRAGRHSKQVKIHGVTSYSTYSLYAKTMHFLKYAAEQPEPIVSLVDDDVFLQPRALMSYAWTLLRASRLDSTPRGELGGGDWYAGRFDWYSWRTETLQPTAYWRGLRGALYGGSLPFRNCSPTGAGWIYGGRMVSNRYARPSGPMPGQSAASARLRLRRGPSRCSPRAQSDGWSRRRRSSET